MTHDRPAHGDALALAARELSGLALQELVEAHTKGRLLGFLGQPRVNVTELNLALAGGAG